MKAQYLAQPNICETRLAATRAGVRKYGARAEGNPPCANNYNKKLLNDGKSRHLLCLFRLNLCVKHFRGKVRQCERNCCENRIAEENQMQSQRRTLGFPKSHEDFPRQFAENL